MPERGKCINMRLANQSGRVAVEDERLVTTARISMEVRGEQILRGRRWGSDKWFLALLRKALGCNTEK